VGVINEFDAHFVANGEFTFSSTFSDLVLQINKNEPSAIFAEQYFKQAEQFLNQIKATRAI
jgi:sulfite reductase (ferredoxin)